MTDTPLASPTLPHVEDAVAAGPLLADGALRARAVKRLSGHAAVPAMVRAVLAGERALAISFAGQGTSYLHELSDVCAANAQVRALAQACQDALVDELDAADHDARGLLTHGIDFMRWLKPDGQRPSASELRRAALSAPLLFVTQMARMEQLWLAGVAELSSAASASRPIVVGHSQGVLGALACAWTFGEADPKVRHKRIAAVARAAFHLGTAMQRGAAPSASPAMTARAQAETGSRPTPMAAVSGVTLDELMVLVKASGADVTVAVQNAVRHHTIAGCPDALEVFRAACVKRAAQHKQEQAQGARPGRVPVARLSWLDVSGPFHTSAYVELLRELSDTLKQRGLVVPAGELSLQVMNGATPLADDGSALDVSMASILVQPQSWRASMLALAAHNVDVVVDCGPGTAVSTLSLAVLRGRGITVLSATDNAQRAQFLHPTQATPAPVPYAAFAPRAVRHDDRVSVDNAFVRACNRPPVFLPGMTPTTVESPIVIAAANAGFLSELAGGGQVTEAVLRARVQELRAGLAPGQGIIFNALYLDPYLWGLHFKKDRLVVKLKSEGAPILGVTISAGIPPLDEAVALLDDLVQNGITLNAFKPGTDAQLHEVRAIAAARPQFNIFVHIEGGKAGGHHSWEDLDDLLVRNYGKLREHNNIIVCVGGGIGTQQQATDYLFGTWSERMGEVAMPVDAVFLGTRLMATLEARTSPQVKAALVAARGSDAWPTAAQQQGGVAAGRSSLDAPIWYLDNAAARAGTLLDSVAGDAAKVLSRRADIIEALAKTAKPYFGDVEHMTPTQVLSRMRALMTTQGDGEASTFDDAGWAQRYAQLARRFARRGTDADALVHPDDARAFVAMCRAPGKPVPFVPVIDADVRRWFKSDSLWQSHDARFGADAVLCIPGPQAVRGIVQQDEPVGVVLQSFAGAFVAEAVSRTGADSLPSLPRDPIARALVQTHAVDEHGLWHPNPLQRLFSSAHATTAELNVRVERDPHGVVTSARLVDARDRTVAHVASRAGALSAFAALQSGEELDLCLSWQDDVTGGHLRLSHAKFLTTQAAFFARVLFAATSDSGSAAQTAAPQPVALFDTAKEPVALTRAQLAAFFRATHDDTSPSTPPQTTTATAPLMLTFPLCWRAIFRALVGAQPDFLALVHEREQTSGTGFVVDEALQAHAKVVSIESLAQGTRVLTTAWLTRASGAEVARTESHFFIRQTVKVGSIADVQQHRALRAELELTAPELAFLRELPFVTLGGEVVAPCRVTLDAHATTAGGSGTLLMGAAVVGAIELHDRGAGEHPLEVLTALLGTAERAPIPDAAPTLLGTKQGRAPTRMHAYAHASGDHNPLHTDVVMARLAGFDAPIVHGMWTASHAVHRVVRLAAHGDVSRVQHIDARFTAPLAPGAAISTCVNAVAVKDGGRVVDVEVTDASGVVVMTARAWVAPVRTAYVYPGQGVQHVGMGMLTAQLSPAARAVWDEADRICQRHHGFSLLDVVKDNPRELWVRGQRLIHPEGVLFLTQFTQVALAVLSVAETASLRERGVFVDGAMFAGHSLGEYSALASVPAVMPLAGVVDIVYRRGLTMDQLISRDVQGRSPYAMGAVRPNLANLSESAMFDLVRTVERDLHALHQRAELHVVNHNVRDRQYAVTGDVFALAELKKRLNAISSGKPAYVDIPGIDVPFHSPLLRSGVDAFRATLDAALPQHIGSQSLCGRYVPNLTGTVFRLEQSFAREVLDAAASPRVAQLLAHWDVAMRDPDALTRSLLIEALAYQFASPVRWIAVQDALMHGAAVQRLVEVGTAQAPVLAQMAKAGAFEAVDVVHSGADAQTLLGACVTEVDDVDVQRVAPGAASLASEVLASSMVPAVVPQPAQTVDAGTLASVLPSPLPYAADALVTLLCVLVKKPRADIDLEKSLDQMLGGNSARRNQVLAEVAAEFGGRAIDNAHEMPLRNFAALLAQMSDATGPGAVLRPLLDAAAHKLLAPAGLDLGRFATSLAQDWSLSAAHIALMNNRLIVAARTATAPKDGGALAGFIDALVRDYGREYGVTLARAAAATVVATVDAGALGALKDSVLGAHGALARVADVLLEVTGQPTRAPVHAQPVVAVVDVEHDAAYHAAIAGVFDDKRHVAFTSSWAWARRDLFDAAVPAQQVGRATTHVATAMATRALADAIANNNVADVARLTEILRVAGEPLPYAGRTALVTGAGERSIARSLVARLLQGGARVIVTTSNASAAAIASFKALYQTHGARGSELHVVPANQGSFADVDALVQWIGSARKERVGSTERLVKSPWLPDIVLPFGAISETADALSIGPRSLALFRVLVLGLERLVAKVGALYGNASDGSRKVRVVLPLSPNHGTFGGDGAYGECKAALEALINKQDSERAWGASTSLVGARIGWVRGTGLMHKNDSAARFFHARGLKTFSADEMADAIMELVTAADAPRSVDLTGGLGAIADLSGLLREHRAIEQARARDKSRLEQLRAQYDARTSPNVAANSDVETAALSLANPTHIVAVPSDADLAQLRPLDHLDLNEVVVIVGVGEVGPWGSARTRWAIESNSTLSIEGVLELAWTMGLIRPDEKGVGFVDAKSGDNVAEHEAVARYEPHILAHAGVRIIEPAAVGFDPNAMLRMVEVRLEQDCRFPVPTLAVAQAMVREDAQHTDIVVSAGAVSVVRKRGGVVRVPASFAVQRKVAGQLPTGWDAARMGVPKSMVEQVDPVTLYCLVSTAEAFLHAGLSPEELFAHLHPGRAGVTIGTGIGGMSKLKRLYRDFYDGAERQNDALQETLINVIGGYVVQSFLGSYGPMSFPVGACATAGLSLAEAVDKIRMGHADLVVAGGADDLSEAGNIGFGDMGATADTDDLLSRGVEPRFMSRPNDARRRGFVESQGAGVMIACRASLALKLSLPVYGVVAFAGSTGDGLQKSVPAPGQGALSLAAETRADAVDATACALQERRDAIAKLHENRSALIALLGAAQTDGMLHSERKRLAHDLTSGRDDISALRAALAVLGLTAQDIGVISKHDSSTQANDLNEAQLYDALLTALGRDDAPLRVISQKSLTGHPKGAAAAWQLNGLMQAMATGIVPGNRSLDNVDDSMQEFARFVYNDKPIRAPWTQMKAGVVTTLGFGHVSALVVLGHPFLFWRMLDDAQRARYRDGTAARMRVADQQLQRVLSGRAPLFVAREQRPFATAAHERSALLDAATRLPMPTP